MSGEPLWVVFIRKAGATRLKVKIADGFFASSRSDGLSKELRDEGMHFYVDDIGGEMETLLHMSGM